MKRVLLWFAAYVAVLGGLAIYRWHVWSYGADTGLFAQVALDAFGGFHDGPEQTSHFAFHWAPLLATLYPFVALTHSALSIQFVQIVLIGAAVFPLYAFLRRYAAEGLASRIALLALLYPPLMAVAFDEFHEIAFYPLIAFLLVWSVDAERWRVFAGISVLSMLIREEVPIVLAVLGAALGIASLLRRGRPGDGLLYWRPRAPRATLLAGVWLVVASGATLAVYFGLVVPALGGWRPAHFYTYPFAHGPMALVAALFAEPLTVLAAVATLGRFTFLLETFVPLLFLPLGSTWFVVALPGLLIVLLSSEGLTWRMGSHYVTIFIPWLLLGTAAVLIGLGRRRSEAAAQRTISIVFGLCALMLIAFNPMHVVHYMTPPYRDLADVRKAFALVPRDAAVSTHDEWYTHYAVEYARASNAQVRPTEYAVFADDFSNPSFRSEMAPWLRDAVARGAFRVVAQYGEVKVYEHGNGRHGDQHVR